MSDKSPLEEDAERKTPDSIDFHIVLTDRDGRDATMALSSLQLLYAPIEVTTTQSLQGIDPGSIATIRFRFDATPAGSIYLDDVAMAREPSASSG